MGFYEVIVSTKFRRWLYSVLVALVPFLTFYGYLEESLTPQLLGLIASTLGFSVAAINTKDVEE